MCWGLEISFWFFCCSCDSLSLSLSPNLFEFVFSILNTIRQERTQGGKIKSLRFWKFSKFDWKWTKNRWNSWTWKSREKFHFVFWGGGGRTNFGLRPCHYEYSIRIGVFLLLLFFFSISFKVECYECFVYFVIFCCCSLWCVICMVSERYRMVFTRP